MPLIASIDGPSRRIFLGPDSVGADIHPVELYKEVRTLRRQTESLRQFPPFMEAKGNDPKGGGKFTERYAVLLGGTRIVPYDTSQTLKVTGTVITDDGQEGVVCFDRAPLTITSRVDIDYRPPQVEVIQITAGSGLSNEESTMLNEVHRILGLTSGSPMTVSGTAQSAGSISLSITDNGDGSVTVART